MPELPEVETICNALKKDLGHAKFINAKTLRRDLRIPFPENIQNILQNHKIEKITRRSKYILIHLDNSKILVIHLGMSGRILLTNLNPETLLEKHTHFIASFDNNKHLLYTDPRRFGLITIIEEKDFEKNILFKNLGPEPFSENFNKNYLFNRLQKIKQSIKISLMDAKIVVGVGNIYASESLFMAKISPRRPSNSLSLDECKILVDCIRKALKKAIEAGGSTLKDYKKADGTTGSFQKLFSVYDRHNKECIFCENMITKIVQGGRTTYYCEKCQK
ncbi:MAG: bifunctional DNA-formamidopyrimidine glycosylase/DNA-(apurinic or apyrimidinic site) lyase [Sphingobacteriia bacterium]|nr:bifunctional DNA-formamidopyrimidine glycosylase/DNA-(apurinic or apyrimidinic site) lyase [Sphingobacteriia bacterium]